MKKRYKKPYVCLERFTMSVSVAACGFVVTPDGALKQDNTDEQMGNIIQSQGGFATQNACKNTLEDFGYYGGTTLVYGSF